MAKKSKKSDRKAPANPADALRDAVERTFQGAAGGASGAQKRVQDVFDDFGAALVRLRETLEERRVMETLEMLRDEVQRLGRRVGDLERGGQSRAGASTPAREPTASRAKPATASRAKPATASRAKPATATRAEPAGTSSSSVRPKPAGKTTAKPKTAAKSTSTRKAASSTKKPASSTRKAASSTRKPAARKPASGSGS